MPDFQPRDDGTRDDDPQDDDLGLPQIPGPPLPDDEAALPPQGDAPRGDVLAGFGESVAALKAADAPPAAPEIGPPDTSRLPGKSFGADIAALRSMDANPLPTQDEPGFVKPPPSRPPAPPPAAAADREATGIDHGAEPQNFKEFQEAVRGMKRADGRPWDSRAVANQYRRYRELSQDNGLEPPAGMEALELFQREGEAGFVQAEKKMVHSQTDLFRLLTAASIEHSRTLTQLRNLLIRNRH